jgi:hypothetical protein
VTFTALFTLGAAAVGYSTHQPAATGAAGLGVVMLGIAVLLWFRATRNFEALSRRRRALERELDQLS